MTENLARKNDQRLAALGELFFAAPPIRALVDEAREDLARGEDQAVIRTRILKQAAEDGLSVSKALFPSLNRKGRRLQLRRVINHLVESFIDFRKMKKFEDVLDAIGEALGFHDFIAGGVLHMAETGEVPPMMEQVVGRVWVQGSLGTDDQMVWAYATPYSNHKELADEFLAKCKELYPDWTRSQYSENAEVMHFFGMMLHGKSTTEMAEESLGEEFLGTLLPGPRQARVAQEADRIRKLLERSRSYMDSFFDEVSD